MPWLSEVKISKNGVGKIQPTKQGRILLNESDKKKNCCRNLLNVLGIDESAVGKLARKIEKNIKKYLEINVWGGKEIVQKQCSK